MVAINKRKVPHTIADLTGSENVESIHIAEAIGYRNQDRGDWAKRGYRHTIKRTTNGRLQNNSFERA